MAAPAPPRPTAPPTTGRERRRFRAAVLGALLVAIVLIAAGGALLMPPGAPPPAPAPPPAAAPTPPPASAEVAVAEVQVDSLDNAELFGDPAASPDTAAVDAAVEGARAALERYLTAMFVRPDSAFTPAPLAEVLTDAARARLTREAERGLGVLSPPPDAVAPGTATAAFRVLADGDAVAAVTVTYEAPMGALIQHGSLVFVDAGGAWRADAVDVVLEER